VEVSLIAIGFSAQNRLAGYPASGSLHMLKLASINVMSI